MKYYEIQYRAMAWTPRERADEARHYHFGNFFREDVDGLLFTSEAEAYAKLDAEYVGDDADGIGVDCSEAVVEIDAEDLHDYKTGEFLGKATLEDMRASRRAARIAGNTGAFLRSGRSVYTN